MKGKLLVSVPTHEFAIDLRRLTAFYKNLIKFDWPAICCLFAATRRATRAIEAHRQTFCCTHDIK